MSQRRLLFCIPTTGLSGGAKVVFEIANRLVLEGDTVDIFSYAPAPTWFPLQARMLIEKDLEDVSWADYDFVIVCIAFMLPVILPFLTTASPSPRAIFYCQDYEPFHHARGAGFEDFAADDPTFVELYQLPLPIITTTQSLQTLIRERSGRDAFQILVGIDKEIFRPQPLKSPGAVKRVLMVGNYLMPYKGMTDAFEALTQLSKMFPIELVLVTSETRNRKMLEELPFPVEVHRMPADSDMPGIIASCDVCCCSSWYEGLGLPALEAMHCGVPVVSTRNYGVSDYGIDGVNLLLANPHDPADLERALLRVLTDDGLAMRLREEGFQTAAESFHWSNTIAGLQTAFDEIASTDREPSVDSETMHSLAERMEREGNFTPIAVSRSYRSLTKKLNDVCTCVASGSIVPDAGIEDIRQVVQALGAYLENPSAEYHAAFRAEYDFGRLVLSFAGNPRLPQALRALLDRRQNRSGVSSGSIREIKYPRDDGNR